MPGFLNSFTCSNQGCNQSTFWLEHSTFARIFKKGDAILTSSWSGICLFSIPSKLLSQILLQKISSTITSVTINVDSDRIVLVQTWYLNLQSLIEKRWEWQSNIYMVFINFEKIFDSVDCHSLWEILLHHGILKNIVLLIIALSLSENNECCVKTPCGQTHFFHILSGIKQGCVLLSLSL